MKRRVGSTLLLLAIFATISFGHFSNATESATPYYKLVTVIKKDKPQISTQQQYEQVLLKMYEEGYVYSHTASVSASVSDGFGSSIETFMVFKRKS